MLNTHAEATFQIPDVTKVLAVPDLLQVYMQPAVVAIAEKIESDLLNLYAGFTANTPLGTAGTPMTEAVIDQAETALFQAKVPTSEPKYLVVDSNTYSAMRQIPRFSEFQKAGDAGSAGDHRRDYREDQRLLRVPFAVCSEDGQFAGGQDSTQSGSRCGPVLSTARSWRRNPSLATIWDICGEMSWHCSWWPSSCRSWWWLPV